MGKAKDSAGKYEAIIEDQKHTINESASSFDSLSSDHRALKKRTNELEFAAIRDREGSEKLKQGLKLSEERASTL